MANTTIDHGVAMPAEPSVRLVGDVIRPSGPGSYPTIVMRTAYDRTTYASVSLQVHALRLAAAGYAVVIQDVRGRFESEGQFEPFINEERDGLATIEWITSQQWCNGVVAGAGASYNAYCQQVVACAAHPALAAWVPALAPADVRDTWIRLGGAFNYGFHLSWALGSLTIPASPAWADPETTTRYGPADQPELKSSAAGDFYFRWLEHSDPYPDASNVPRAADLAAVASPGLVIAGTYDVFYHGSVELFRLLASQPDHQHSLVIGPWDHSGLPLGRRSGDADFGLSAQLDLGALQTDWYDLHLRGIGEAPPTARVFVTGASEWLSLSAWPPVATNWVLEPDHAFGLVDSADLAVVPLQIDASNPTPTRGGRIYPWEPLLRPGAYDQSGSEHQSDVLVFTGAPLIEPVRVLGPAQVEVTVGSTERASDVFAVLCDVARDGVALNIADGVQRRTWSNEESVRFTIDLGDVAHEFGRGHRVRLMLSAGSFPRFDAFRWRGERFFHLGNGLTRLILPLVDGG